MWTWWQVVGPLMWLSVAVALGCLAVLLSAPAIRNLRPARADRLPAGTTPSSSPAPAMDQAVRPRP